MTRQINLYLLIAVLAAVFLTATSPIQAQASKHYEACQTLGGEYEERRTNCKPECETTYICRFGDGWSRICDEQGECQQAQDESSTTTSDTEGSSEQDDVDSSNENDMSFEDCVADAADHCRAQCDNVSRFDAVDCARDCLEDQEGRCEENDIDSDGECEECQDFCEDACDRFQQSWRRNNCLSECESRCDNVCN